MLFGDKKHAKPVLNTPLLKMPWAEYLEKVLCDKYHGIDDRIGVLEASRRLFEERQTFNRMSIEERGGIAGFGGQDDVAWGWFGSIFGAGVFKNRVNANDNNLSRALDAIPLNGKVQKEDYLEFISAYKKAYPTGRGHGLATATRLLMMKRPDYFVCFDSANRRGLSTAFGISLYGHDYERYWDSIIERILISEWWNSPRPRARPACKCGMVVSHSWTLCITSRNKAKVKPKADRVDSVIIA
jgi:hypothetical protein